MGTRWSGFIKTSATRFTFNNNMNKYRYSIQTPQFHKTTPSGPHIQLHDHSVRNSNSNLTSSSADRHVALCSCDLLGFVPVEIDQVGAVRSSATPHST